MKYRKTEIISFKGRSRQGCPHSPSLFNIVLEFPARAISKEKEIDSTREGRNKIIHICRLYDLTFKGPQRFHQKKPS
jgi:hypothetical protein